MSTPALIATGPATLEPAYEHHNGVPPDNVRVTPELGPDLMTDFKANMRNHFAGRLGDKWDCSIAGHTVCVLTVDGGHHQLSEESVNLWVDFLCQGEATTAQPPDGILSSGSSDEPSSSMPRAVSIAPSRRRCAKSSILAASTSLRQSLECISYSSSTSGAYGPGYRGGQAIEWLGKKTLDGVYAVLIWQRVLRYQYRLHQYSKDPARNAEKAYKVLENVLDMLRPCNSPRTRLYAARLNHKASSCTPRLSHISQVTDAILEVFRLTIDSDYPKLEDLMYEIIYLLTKSPLSLQGPQSIVNVVNAILQELMYTPRSKRYDTSSIHFPALLMLRRVRDFWPKATFDLDSIYQLRTRRLHSRNDDPQSCIPWELEFFVIIEIQDPSFRDIVLGPHGMPGLFSVAEALLCHDALSDDGWNILNEIFWTLSNILRVKWVCDIVESQNIKICVETMGRKLRSTSNRHEWLIHAVLSCLEHIITNNPAMVAALITNDAGAVIRQCLASAVRDTFYTPRARAVLRKIDQASSQESH